MNRRGFLRLALGALGIASAMGVAPEIVSPFEDLCNRRWRQRIEIVDKEGNVVAVYSFECFVAYAVAS